MQPKKMFYSMGEVAEMFDVKPSLLRFWEAEFDILKPKRNKKGNRLFTPSDVENLKLIYHLVKERGMTLEGAKRTMKQNRRGKGLSRDAELLERLQKIRAELAEVRDGLRDGTDEEPARDIPTDDNAAAAESSPTDGATAQKSGRRGRKPAVKVIEEHRQRVVRRKRDDEGQQNPELFAFYEQSLF